MHRNDADVELATSAPRILVVEDDPGFVSVLQSLIRKEGVEAEYVHVRDLRSLSEAVQDRTFDAVLIADGQADFSGADVLERLRREGIDSPCLLLTGPLPDHEAAVLMRKGAADVIPRQNIERMAPALMRELGRDRDRRRIVQQGEREVRDQIRRLTAVHRAERAVAGNTDLGLALRSILEQVCEVTPMLGASIHAVDPGGVIIRRVACHWGTSGLEPDEEKLGRGFAGRVAMSRRIVFEPLEGPGGRVRSVRIGIPLATRGRTVGVMDVERLGDQPGPPLEMQCLEALASNAAVALENDRLWTELEQANCELRLAYEAALEGWSRALDLRDGETEGHSSRVAAMTTRLAEYLGESRGDLVHIRRGALLHDIGKVAVPDSILRKAGPLTEEEWSEIREHPALAYEMLAPISFLRPALDIPYCHHERWDGAGYPQGLQGMQIPRAARIFAVVDVYDALTSNRPYRPGWTHEQAMEYIATHSGTQFDPQVVRAFQELVQANEFPLTTIPSGP